MAAVAAHATEAAIALLHGLGAPVTTTGVRLLVAWITCEKGAHGDAWQWNNPLNTTERGFGSTQVVNAAGVRAYPTQAAGIAATVATLRNGHYPHLLAGLRAGDAATFFAGFPGEMTTWGTDPACVQQVYAEVGGTVPAPPASGPGPAPEPVAPLAVLAAAGAVLYGVWVLWGG